ncbi:MAG: hypothetical protein ACKPKO_26085, partial [Candidatus Fonsibacter sp.]
MVDYTKGVKGELAQEVEERTQQAAGYLAHQMEQNTAQLQAELTSSLNASLGASLAEVIRAQMAAFAPQQLLGQCDQRARKGTRRRNKLPWARWWPVWCACLMTAFFSAAAGPLQAGKWDKKARLCMATEQSSHWGS